MKRFGEFWLKICFAILAVVVFFPSISCSPQSKTELAYAFESPRAAPENYGNGVYFFPRTGFDCHSTPQCTSDLTDFMQKNPQLEVVSVAAVNSSNYGETTGVLVVFREKSK